MPVSATSFSLPPAPSTESPSGSLSPEQTPREPVNPYGASKLFFENALEAYDRAYGLRSARLRYFNAAGADDSGEIGELHDPETHLIPLALLASTADRPELQIFGDDYPTPDGTCLRDYIHVNDLADAHVRALQHLEKGGESLALNLGTGRGNSVLEVIHAAEKATGQPVRRNIGPRRPGDPPILVADASKAKEVLEWTAQRDLTNIVQHRMELHASQCLVEARTTKGTSELQIAWAASHLVLVALLGKELARHPEIARSNCLFAREKLDRIPSMGVQVAKEGIFPPGKRKISRRGRDAYIDAYHADLDPPAVLAHRGAVFGKDRRAVAARVAVDERDCLIQRADVHHGEHWTKNFLSRNSHPRFYIIENRRSNKVAARGSALWVAAIHQQLGSLFDSAFDGVVNALARGVRNNRPKARFGILAIAGDQLPASSFSLPMIVACAAPTVTSTDPAMQRWPALPNALPSTFDTVLSTTASGITTM